MNLKYKKYDNYKPSGVEWLGNVPKHWEVTKLKNVIKAKITDGPHETPTFLSNGIPFLSVDGIQNGELVFEKCRYISETAHSQYIKKCNVEKYDILMGKAASIGKIAQVKVDFDFSIWSPLALIKPNTDKIKSTFLEYVLKNQTTQTQIELLCTINTQKNISMGDIPKIVLPIPPKSEQTAIANFLDRKTAQIDKAIAQKGQLIELLKERRQILIHEAVTQGLDKSVEMKDSGVEWIGEVPKGWEVKKLKHVGKMVNGYAFNSNEFVEQGVRVMKISNIQTMNIDWSEASFINEKYYDKLPQYRIFKNDIVFALTRPIISTGIKAAIVKSNDKILLNQRNAVLKSFNNVIDKWIYFIILNDAFVQEFDNEIDKTGQQPNISVYSIGNLFVPVPSIKEQQEIVNYIETQNEKIKTAISLKEREISSLKEYKTVLIDAAVTGKVIVD
jgi:type I restriction enzyme S subunit